ncbi:MAG: glutamate--tRNA ligase, partial [Deltaproteobacteria bacterium]|nr:glutamate--tRNA ligase [Deltaproteobacteria bacterium]
EVRTRFSPSPTGSLHLGGTRTALFNWLFARHHGGVFILRIEDTDRERSEERFVREIEESMRWLGLDWDEGPYFQSERLPIYQEYIQRLLDQGLAYYCDCDPADLEVRRKEALARGDKPKYDGRCRDRGLKPGPHTAVRFKTAQTGTTNWHDRGKGPIAFDNRELDDLVIQRADGIPTYNFAVVVDDITMGVTHVIRGEDHIPNTPRQILIYQALGAALPEFAHMTVTLAPGGGKLSKRRGALPILSYREQGFLPQALVNYMVRLGWAHGDQEIFSREELIQYFSLEHMSKSPGVYDEEKLLWLNSYYIKETPLPELARLLLPFLERLGLTAPDLDYVARVAGTLNTRCKTLVEMADAARFYFQDPRPYEEKGARKFLTPETAPNLEEIKKRLETMADFSETALNQLFQDLTTETGLKMLQLAQPVRLALTGKTVSPGLFDIISILGKPEVLKRLNLALDFIYKKQ